MHEVVGYIIQTSFFFSRQENETYIHMLNGLFLSLHVKMKLESQVKNLTNNNDICIKIVGNCVERRHKEYKDFLRHKIL